MTKIKRPMTPTNGTPTGESHAIGLNINEVKVAI
jgi:hypothetical protein